MIALCWFVLCFDSVGGVGFGCCLYCVLLVTVGL